MDALRYTVGNRTHIVRPVVAAPFYVLEDSPLQPHVKPVLLPYSDLDMAREYAAMRGCLVLDERLGFVR